MATRLAPEHADAFARVAALNGRSTSAELARVAMAHVDATVKALEQEGGPAVDGQPGPHDRPAEGAEPRVTAEY